MYLYLYIYIAMCIVEGEVHADNTRWTTNSYTAPSAKLVFIKNCQFSYEMNCFLKLSAWSAACPF